jgi:hypothetical protein
VPETGSLCTAGLCCVVPSQLDALAVGPRATSASLYGPSLAVATPCTTRESSSQLREGGGCTRGHAVGRGVAGQQAVCTV